MLLPKNSYATIGSNHADVQILFWNDEFASRLTKLVIKGYHQLFVFSKGTGVHEIAFEDYKITDCSYHIVPAGIPHMIRAFRKVKGVIICFTDAYLEHLIHFDFSALEEGSEHERYIYKAHSEEFRKLYNAILPYANDLLKQHKDSLLLNVVAVLLLKIIRNHQEQLSTNKNRFIARLYNQINKHLQCKYCHKPQQSVVSKELNMPEEQLNYNLKIYFKCSLLQLQRHNILRSAKELLYKTSLHPAEIAEQLGFRNEYEFLKFFRKHTGMGPAAYKCNYYNR